MKNTNLKKLATLGVLAACSVVLMLAVRIPFPPAPFLEYDPADIPILIGTFLFGPVAGFALTVVVSLLQGLTVSAGSGWIGIVMHVAATGCFALLAGFIYKKHHDRKHAYGAYEPLAHPHLYGNPHRCGSSNARSHNHSL